MANVTTCLTCETQGLRTESFFDLSVDVPAQESVSLSHCIKSFSNKELMSKNDKFYCEECCAK